MTRDLVMWRAIAYTLILAFVVTAQAQVEQRSTNPPRETRSSPVDSVERPDAATAEIHLARSLSEKLWGLRDLKTRTLGTAKLASLFWKQDPTYAPGLFEKALSLTIPATTRKKLSSDEA
ncbi:MAG TPA: hypothetical protein VF074_14400 [Pyrinomonadaceae bacterium]